MLVGAAVALRELSAVERDDGVTRSERLRQAPLDAKPRVGGDEDEAERLLRRSRPPEQPRQLVAELERPRGRERADRDRGVEQPFDADKGQARLKALQNRDASSPLKLR